MSSAVVALLDQAREVFGDDPLVVERIDAQAERLAEPMRVALVGMVKSGKSTLLNALLGEEVAATDTAECTRIVTWYRFGETPQVVVNLSTGEQRSLPVRRRRGQLAFSLGPLTAQEVSHIVVSWPTEVLRGITLIDTPGVGSVSTDVSRRAREFLLPEGEPAAADVVVYVTRHPHETDLALLGALRDAAAGLSRGVATVVVLGRADELGAGRIDSLLAARGIAARYAQEPEVAALAVQVIPVAGLLGQGARTLAQSDLVALRKVAALDRATREDLLVSADRFTTPGSQLDLTRAERVALLDRFGVFGIRLASVLLSHGVERAADLSRELARRSGIEELGSVLQARMRGHADFLKADAALALVEALVRAHPDASALEAGIERVRSGAHELQELRTLATLAGSPLAAAQRDEATRLLGGFGTSAPERLGRPEADSAELLAAAHEAAARWHALAEATDTAPELSRVARVLSRSAEGVIAELDDVSAAAMPLALAAEPRPGAGQHAGHQRRAG